MSLTVKEKEHWKNRISRRIDHAIEQLQARNDPGYYKRICDQAEEVAWKSLGLEGLRDESKKVADEIDSLQKRKDGINAEMLSKVTGKPVDTSRSSYMAMSDVTAAVKRRAMVHETELMEAHSLGSQILRLRHEKEELLDTVWLASSPSQIKELWSRFAEVLNWEPPKLQKEALSIPPLSSES
ncbi:MAG: hypothetical protein R3E01_33495 [Pirellulaceae bacterium]